MSNFLGGFASYSVLPLIDSVKVFVGDMAYTVDQGGFYTASQPSAPPGALPVWAYVDTLRGAPGSQGVPGVGVPGPQGLIGPPGIPGSRGPQGLPGKSSISYLAQAWTVPALGVVQRTYVSDTSWMTGGTLTYIPGAGTFTVIGAPIDSQTVNLANSGDPNNQPAGIQVQAGTIISPASQRGPAGPQGVVGPAGPAGPQGASGTSAYSVTTQAFAVPAVGQSAVCFVQAALSFGVGQIVFVAAGDYMSVQGVNTTNNTLTLRNMGLLGTAAGTNIPVGSTVSGTGPQGPQGVAGPQGPAGPQGLIGVAPTGAIYMWPAVTAPGGYLFCQGQLVSRSTYSALFSIIATTYNYGTPDEDSTNFRLPNFQGRVPLGAGQATAVPPSQPAAPAGATNHGLASAGGEETHLLITGELAAHLHPITDLQHTHPDPQHSHTGYTSTHSHTGHDTGHTHPAAAPQAIGYGQAGGPMYQAVSGNTGVGYAQIAIDAAAALTVQTYNAASNLGAQYTGITGTQSTGNNQPHNTMMPYLTVNYIIKT